MQQSFTCACKARLDVEYLCASASPNPNRWSDKVPSRALTIKEIDEMIDAFAKTAKLCKEAGVDGIEIHAVHEAICLTSSRLNIPISAQTNTAVLLKTVTVSPLK